MNGSLYPQPQGALMDPRQTMLMQMGLGLMAGSGPSRTPVSLGQAFGQAGMQGLQGMQQAQKAQLEEAYRQAQMKQMEEMVKMKQAEEARKINAPQAYGPGTQLFRPGEVDPFHTVPFRPAEPPKPQPPMTRKVRIGEEEVTQEYVDGKWGEVGRGPAFAKTVAPIATPPQAPKAPPGFRFKADAPDQLEPIPGGPKDTSGKDKMRADGAIRQADLVIGKVDEALGKTGFFSTGLIGTALGNVPGTNAYDLDATIDTIKANLGFDRLQAMREASPTGGALGQIAVQELNSLQSVVASLKKGQKEETLRNSLGQVKKHYETWKKALQDDQAGSQPQPTAPQPEAPKRRTYNLKSGKFE